MSLDTLYTAETPEGIALSLRPAGVTARALAYLLDLLIRIAVFLALLFALRVLFGGMAGGLLAITYFAIEWFYSVLFELLPKHATPGKRALGLTVVMDSGLPITPAASLLRNLLRAVDFFPLGYGAAWVSMLCRADFKRLGDLAAGTLVVYQPATGLHAQLPQAPPLAPRRPLSSREQAAVVSWASRTERLSPARSDELAQLASSILPPHAPDATQALRGVAQWLVGRREGEA